jgi:hypothetical protein
MEFAPARKTRMTQSVTLVDKETIHKMKMWTNKTIKGNIYLRDDSSLHYPSAKKGFAWSSSMTSEKLRASTNFKQVMKQEIDEGIAFYRS